MKAIGYNSTSDCSKQPATTVGAAQWTLRFAALGALVMLLGLSGCATPATGGSGDFEPAQYNPNTGYPAIGGGVPWHM